jgi:hypothetical protein
MSSHKLLPLVGIAIWVAAILTVPAGARSHRHFVNHVVLADDEPNVVAGCTDLHMHFDHHDAVYQSEERSISRAEAATLRVQAEHNGGLRVQGWDKDNYGVTLCKAAEEGSGAQSLLSQIHLNFHDQELSVSGPSFRNHWAAFLLVRAPKNAALDLEAVNGPLSLHHVDGKVKVHAVNGPVSAAGCTGEMELSSQNGPVTLDGNSGKFTVRSENGPLTVNLNGSGWTGAGMDAHVNNGPLTLNIPSGYTSGVVLESQGPGPFSCGAAVCSQGRKTWDDDRKRVEFGTGPTVVRVSAVNGPINVI